MLFNKKIILENKETNDYINNLKKQYIEQQKQIFKKEENNFFFIFNNKEFFEELEKNHNYIDDNYFNNLQFLTKEENKKNEKKICKKGNYNIKNEKEKKEIINFVYEYGIKYTIEKYNTNKTSIIR